MFLEIGDPAGVGVIAVACGLGSSRAADLARLGVLVLVFIVCRLALLRVEGLNLLIDLIQLGLQLLQRLVVIAREFALRLSLGRVRRGGGGGLG